MADIPRLKLGSQGLEVSFYVVGLILYPSFISWLRVGIFLVLCESFLAVRFPSWDSGVWA